ncbi:MAG: hypothetical protein LBO74_18090 [Candidatus Symbiothrix sp.]|nr:hypothetical protein [Candidatus Symbiothrix sp.]
MKEKKQAVTNIPLNNVYKMLDFLSLSVKGLNLENKNEWHLKRNFFAYYEEKFVKDKIQSTFYDFSDTIKFDIDIWQDYNGITGNLASKGIVFDTEGNIEYADGVNHMKIHQIEKYGDNDFPYLQLLRHTNFIQLLEDNSVYENLKTSALKEIKDGHKYELSIVEDRIREIENDLPQFISDRYRIWYLETRVALDGIKSLIYDSLSFEERDIKSFVYLMHLVFSCAGFETSKGKSFSKYLALFLCERQDTIDKYLKEAHNDTSLLWNKPDRNIQRLITVLKQIKTFKPNEDILEKISKIISRNLPKEEMLKFLTDEEKVLYRNLKICCE